MTTVDGGAGNLIAGGNFTGPVQQFFYAYYRETLAAGELDAEVLTWINAIHVEPPEFGRISEMLQNQSAIALTGPPGCGRRTTGIALLMKSGVTPHNVILDLEDLDRPLEILPGHGYLLDLDDDRDDLFTAKVATWLQELTPRVRRMGARLVVRARVQSWKILGVSEYALGAVELAPPTAEDVLRNHLRQLTTDSVAKNWAELGQVCTLLADAKPPDAVRLAQIIKNVQDASFSEPRQLEEATAAYANWADALKQEFDKYAPTEGHHRALLLSIAALDGAPAATVFAAANQLAQLVELPLKPGAALTGPDIGTVMAKSSAELRGANIHFTRPAYAESVLDYVWRERPHMQSVLREWLIGIPESGEPGSDLAAGSLTKLATRQNDARLVCSAAVRWAGKSSRLRDLGVEALTATAMSEKIGRSVRRQLYDWAKSASSSEQLHLIVASVCAGPLAQAYPQIALTRLRHLAVRQPENVRVATLDALTMLARNPALRHVVISEVAAWLNDERRQAIGRQAFLQLVQPEENGEIAVLPMSGNGESPDLNLLASLWRDALHQPDLDRDVLERIWRWLDAAVRGLAPRATVIEILARTCRGSSRVFATISRIAICWPRPNDEYSPMRLEILVELLDRAREYDPISSVPASEAGEGS